MNSEAAGGSPSAATTELERIWDFGHRVMQASASEVVPVRGGFAVLTSDFPNSYEHNCLVIQSLQTPELILAEADRVLGGAGLEHRSIEVEIADLDPAWLAVFQRHGYQVERNLVMVLRWPPERTGTTAVARVPYSELMPAVAANWRRLLPRASQDSIRQLVERRSTTHRACQVTHHAVVVDGRFVARCDLYRIAPIAQVESVETDPEWRNRGYATAVVLDAVALARSSGCELIFLMADQDDWPQRLYRRLGFEPVGAGYTLQRGLDLPQGADPSH